MRIDKFICKSTELTRNEATLLINAENVTVNNEVVSNEVTQVFAKGLTEKVRNTYPDKDILDP